jgi:hypothetical protein
MFSVSRQNDGSFEQKKITERFEKGATTLSITTLRIMTFSITTLNIMTLSITTFSIMTLSIMTLSIRMLSIMTFSTKITKRFEKGSTTLSIRTLSIMTLSIAIKNVTFRIMALRIMQSIVKLSAIYAQCHIQALC